MKPLVLLDVDGVINDLGPLQHDMPFWRGREVRAGAYWVYIPDYMPALIQRLTETADIHWCTTWRDKANTFISPLLGISDDLPVVDDGTGERTTGWKAAAAYERVAEALDQGRDVYWIEDFYGLIPSDELPEGVIYVDTTTVGLPVLMEDMLPPELTMPSFA